MGLGTSILLIAAGAILRFAVSVSTHGVNLHRIGVILMVVGGIGLVVSARWMTVLADRRSDIATAGVRQEPIVRETEY